MPTVYDKEKISPKILCLQRERFTADPLSSFWSVRRRKRERRGGFGVLGFAYPEFQFKIVVVCKKACKTHQIVSRGF
jgi:hypothetical protein